MATQLEFEPLDHQVALNKPMVFYDDIGTGYAQTRRGDPRISAQLLGILEPLQVRTVADIGAGTGSYAFMLAEQGYRVVAVEPSKTMREQAIAHPHIQWFEDTAESLPLPARAVDAAIVMLAFHHFQDPQQALREIHRVTSGPLVLFTYDPAAITSFWLTQYFPAFIADVQSTFIPIQTLATEIQTVWEKAVEVSPFPLPHDLTDAFAAVGWRRPELYCDRAIRNGISSFAKLTNRQLQQGLSALQADLETGIWDQKYGYLRQQQTYDAGYCFVYTV